MNDEELELKAKESFNNKLQKDVCYCTYNEEKIYKDGYLAGAKENGIVWHDLRKDPEDLPKEEDDYLLCLYDKDTKSVFYEVMGIAKRYADGEDWYVESMIWTIDDVIAWCETPKFEVVE